MRASDTCLLLSSLVVCERAGRSLVVDRRWLLLQTWQLTLEVADKHRCHVVGKAASDDDPQRCEVGAVLGKRVRGHLPPALAQRVRHIEDCEVLDALGQRE